jgi:hypothetical protein
MIAVEIRTASLHGAAGSIWCWQPEMAEWRWAAFPIRIPILRSNPNETRTGIASRVPIPVSA